MLLSKFIKNSFMLCFKVDDKRQLTIEEDPL